MIAQIPRIYTLVAKIYFLVATILLMALASALVVIALIDLISEITSGVGELANTILDSAGLIIIGFAIIETAKFIAEEEVFRQRELRSKRESRRSLTKFVTIIVIATSLEALMMIFKTSRTSISDAIYPALLFIAAMIGQMALGVYQWLSSRAEEDSGPAESRERPIV